MRLVAVSKKEFVCKQIYNLFFSKDFYFIFLHG